MLEIIRWLITSILTLLWLYIASYNAGRAWRECVQKEQNGPSPVGLAGGIIALFIFAICPLGHWHDRRAFLLIPLLLDYGSLPYICMGAVNYVLDICRPGRRGKASQGK